MLFISLFSICISIFILLKSTHSRIQRIIFISLIFISLFLIGGYFISDMLTHDGFNEAVLYHLHTGLAGSGLKDFWKIILLGVIVFIAIIYLCIVLYSKMYSTTDKKFIYKFSAIGLILFSFISNPIFKDMTVFFTKSNNDFFQYYIYPSEKIKLSKKKNIVYIYAESLEKTYFDNNIFPNLITNLKKLEQKSIDFTNIFQAYSTGWTIAGMTASQCTIPLITPSGINSMNGLKDNFLQNALCLGDILKDNNYTLEYFGGSSLKFAGKGNFYKSHSFDKVFGKEELKHLLKDKKYITGWGLYDDTLLDIVYKEFENLSRSNRNFFLATLTLDTHHPEGHSSKTCIDNNIYYKDGSNSMLNAIKCSDYLLAKFINKILKSPYAKNTIIILGSDHYAMPNKIYNMLETGDRKDLLMIIDGNNTNKTTISKLGTTLDIAPTILNLLGAKNPNFGLGRNLLDDNVSLINIFKQNQKYTVQSNVSQYKKNSLDILSLDAKLISWRDFFLLFWSFPKITHDITINPKNKTLKIGNKDIAYPSILELKNKTSVIPYFNFNSRGRLENKLQRLGSTPYIWIDNCIYMQPVMYIKQRNDKQCIAFGRRNQPLLYIKQLNQVNTIPLELIDEIKKPEDINEDKFNNFGYKKSLLTYIPNNYNQHTFPKELKSYKNIDEFLIKNIKNPNKLILITASRFNFGKNHQQFKSYIGYLKSRFANINNNKLYCGIFNKNHIIQEVISKHNPKISIEINGFKIDMQQTGNANLEHSSIYINGVDISPNRSGINIVILSLDTGKVETLSIESSIDSIE